MLSHCYDDSIQDGQCQKCLQDQVKGIDDVGAFGEPVQGSEPVLRVSKGLSVVGDHLFDIMVV